MPTPPAVTQGQFSFLPGPHRTPRSPRRSSTRSAKVCLWSVEYTDDPHPRNTYWEMYGMPMFDLKDAAGVMLELNACRKTFLQPLHPVERVRFDARGFDCDAPSTVQPVAPPGGRGQEVASPAPAGRRLTPPTNPRPTFELA